MQTTFYLKYRPQSFSDLDSTLAREELQKIFSSGKITHAFLFSGPKGIGKTSAARIVAKAVNCLENQGKDNKKNLEPCNRCDNCKSITAGTNVDIIEIDAASNRGIDDIKELREKIKLAPAFLKYKVYIIDEAHMLTTEAFNALLKTLEEPPEHAIFILCTTDTEKLPKTIISRCQRINFRKATKEEIVGRLKKNCEAEKLEHEKGALEEIAKLSEGSFRDATKLLEQVSFAGKITLEGVRQTAGVLGEFKAEELLGLLKEKKTKEALEWVGRAAEAGINLKILLENLTEILRSVLLENFGIKGEEESVSLNFSPNEAISLINLLGRAYLELRTAVIPQLPLEMLIMQWGVVEPDETSTGEFSEEKDDKDEELTPSGDISSGQSGITLNEVEIKWQEILEKVKPLNHSVQAFLKACRPVALEGSLLTLEVFWKFHKEQLEKDQCRRIFEQSASQVLGCTIRLRCVLGQKPLPAKPTVSVNSYPEKAEDSVTVSPDSPKLNDADIMKIAEEIFNGGGTVQ